MLTMDWAQLLVHSLASLERIGWGVAIALFLAWGISLTAVLSPRVGRVFSTFILSDPQASTFTRCDAPRWSW